MKIIATHDGRFHADEVLAISMLKRVYPKVKIIRTRNPEKLKGADILVDVGGEYNPERGLLDHHQKSFKEKRKNGIPYASAGIVWKHFGEEIVNNDRKAWEYLDNRMVQSIDKIDTDSSLSPESMFLYTLDKAIKSFSPLWNSKDQDWDKKFGDALLVMEKVLDNEIAIAGSISKADRIVTQNIKDAEEENRDYIFVPHPNIPFMETCMKNPRIKYVIHPYMEGKWHAIAVTKNTQTYETRKPFPESWRGLDGKILEKASGVKGAFFCHKAGFVAGATSRESMIKMVEKSLNSK